MKRDPCAIFKIFRKKLENEIFEPCHSAEKCKRGTLWNFVTSTVLQIIETNEGDPLVQSKNFQKKSHNAEKILVKNT